MSQRKFSKIAVVGGSSEIAVAILRNLPPADEALLAGRDEKRLLVAASALEGWNVRTVSGVISSEAGIREMLAKFPDRLDLAIVAQGILGSSSALHEGEEIAQLFRVNLEGPAMWLSALAEKYGDQDCRICVISSVAGDRGRASNYLYGASKAGLSVFAEGLAMRCFQEGKKCRFTILKPGLVRTRMTAGREDMRLAADCDAVGRTAARALLAGKAVVYAPFWWRYAMLAVRMLPAFVMRRLRS
ncbi:MAG: SDR family NAD(P)-dependent oxidoreductase [Succinivibrionaceae bacterium]|nr:SDR family NAD(P)-dependent oxidoreductase [Succinivibrionaceae bacterium]